MEKPSLSVDERRLVVEATVIAADGMPVIAGTVLPPCRTPSP